MSLYASCPCGIPEGSPEPHLRTDCPLYSMTSDSDIVSASDRLARRMGGRFRVSASAPEPPLDTIQRLGQEMEQADQYVIIKNGAYYRPNAAGYTMNIAEAGRYSLEDAIRHSHPNGPDGPRDGITYEPAPPAQPDMVGELVEALEEAGNVLAYIAECSDDDHCTRKAEAAFKGVNDTLTKYRSGDA